MSMKKQKMFGSTEALLTRPLDSVLIDPVHQLIAPIAPFTKLEYVKFDNATIDTGIMPDDDFTKIELGLLLYGLNTGDNNYIFGNTLDSSNPWYSLEIHRVNRSFQCNLGTTTYVYWKSSSTAVELNKRYDFSLTCSRGSANFSGTYSNVSRYSGQITKSRPIQICPYVGNGYAKLYLYSCNIETSSQKLALIPVEDSCKVACLYDTISYKFFYNIGIGSIIAGPKLKEIVA